MHTDGVFTLNRVFVFTLYLSRILCKPKLSIKPAFSYFASARHSLHGIRAQGLRTFATTLIEKRTTGTTKENDGQRDG